MKPIRNNNAGIPALTPTPPISGLLSRSELVLLCSQQRDQIKTLIGQVTLLRRRHDKAEATLTKYTSLLEKEISEQTNRVHSLRVAMLPKLEVQHD